jgi:uncharacterized protein involved in exopolysaccharide biosynthesis
MHIAEQDYASDHLTFSRWMAGILLRWKTVVAFAVGALLLGVIATVIVPPVYRTNASFVANSSS